MEPYQNNLKILHWAEEDRPREKLLMKGKSALTDAELIAILIGSGTVSVSAVELSKQILQSASNNLSLLAKMEVKDLMKFKGIGEAKAITIVAALELGRRRKNAELPEKPKITCSKDIYDYMYTDLIDLIHEQFWLISLNRANKVISKHQLSSGGTSATVVDIKILLKKALEDLASSIILAHNHPSGNTKPSEQDIQLTKKIKSACEAMDISLLDHLIFAEKNYYSFADEGII